MTSIIICGPSACGKTTVGKELARLTGWTFKDGDDLHSKTNIEKMKAGIPLTDDDRLSWLRDIVDFCKSTPLAIVACSALKRCYRKILRNGTLCRFILLDVSRPLLEKRILQRKGHFMPPGLLDSQLSTLQYALDEPDIISIKIDREEQTPTEIAQHAMDLLGKN